MGFEAHTTGFGARYLAKYGFKERLGKREDGIREPLQPSVAPAAPVEAEEAVPWGADVGQLLGEAVAEARAEAEEAVRRAEGQLGQAKARIRDVERRRTQRRAGQSHRMKQREKLREVKRLVEAGFNASSVQSLGRIVETLHIKLPEETAVYSALAVVPHRLFRLVQELSTSTLGSVLRQWRPLLYTYRLQNQTQNLWTRLLHEAVVPTLSRLVPSIHDVTAVDMVERWVEELDHTEVSDTALEAVILAPLLQSLVTIRDAPCAVFAWLPLLDTTSLFPTLVDAVSSALCQQLPTMDAATVRETVDVWEPVLGAQEVARCLARAHLEEKMKQHVAECWFESMLDWDALEDAIAWARYDLVDCSLVTKHMALDFFPQLFHHAFTLTCSTADPASLRQLYTRIRTLLDPLLPSRLLETRLCRLLALFSAALSNRDTLSIYAALLSEANDAVLEREQRPRGSELGMMDMLTHTAAEHGVPFHPHTSRQRVQGKQVYVFGRHFITLEQETLFRLHKSTWKPVSLDQLL